MKKTPPSPFRLEHDAESLGLVETKSSGETRTHRVAWRAVHHVTAFKEDLLTVDRICLAIETIESGGFRIDEEMPGWANVVEKLPEYLPGCLSFSAWFQQVAHPAFETKSTVIFERAKDRETSPEEQANG